MYRRGALNGEIVVWIEIEKEDEDKYVSECIIKHFCLNSMEILYVAVHFS